MLKKITSDRGLLLVLAMLIIAFISSHIVPKPKYVSQNILSRLDIPFRMDYWQGQDVSEELNIRDERYNFIGQVFARNYQNDLGDRLLCLILDVNNFHPPANCYKSAGYEILEQDRITVKLPGNSIERTVQTFYANKKNDGILVVYWTCINRAIPSNWLSSELSQLWSNLTGRDRVGIMVRLDIPTQRNQIDNARHAATDFIKKLYSAASPDIRAYILGN